MRCSNCKKIIVEEHRAISYKLWGYWYHLCSVDCAKSVLLKAPELKDINPNLANDVELKARSGQIEVGSCCKILESHHDLLKDDPEHLPTEFIKELSMCKCKKEIPE